jgi:hypothetical protein
MFDLSEVGTHVLEGKILSLLLIVLPGKNVLIVLSCIIIQMKLLYHQKWSLILKVMGLRLVMRLNGTVQ